MPDSSVSRASAVATLLTRTVFGDAPVFVVPSLAMAGVWEIVPYTALGLLGGAALVLLPLASLVRYYEQEQREGRTNAPYFHLLATVEASRVEDRPVLLDSTGRSLLWHAERVEQ